MTLCRFAAQHFSDSCRTEEVPLHAARPRAQRFFLLPSRRPVREVPAPERSGARPLRALRSHPAGLAHLPRCAAAVGASAPRGGRAAGPQRASRGTEAPTAAAHRGSIPGENWRGHLTNITNSGQCPVCSHQLEDSELSKEEYNNLSERIIRDVIHGTDTFRKTSPQEFEAFQTFVENRLPFDIVIDGLNVSHIKPRKLQCENLFEAVNCLAKNNARLLVLGRKHMLVNSSNWKREIMKEMQNKADFFFAENISEDDAFLLYATLRSGKHCKFVTRDFLRDHKACLSDSLTRHLFRKWQRGHQIVLLPSVGGNPMKFLPAFSYDCVVQTTGDTWHIPYKDAYEEKYSYRVPRKWLCLHRKYRRV